MLAKLDMPPFVNKSPKYPFAILAFLLLCRLSASAVTFEIDDPVEFAKIINTSNPHVTNATVTIGSGGISGNPVEAPVWIPSGGGYLIFSDLVNNKLKKIVLPNTVTDYLTPAASTLCNGSMLDAQERQFSCEAGTAGLRVVMITNGVVTPIVSTCNGLKFYSPNDLCFKSDGTLWFTDPGYNGVTAPPQQPGFAAAYYVYRCDPANGNATCTAVISGLSRPNGLCFSPDESKLYVADSGPAHHILVYSVSTNNTVSSGTLFATIAVGIPDGIRCDVNGRVWSSSGEGVSIFAPDGHLIGKIKYGLVSNLCFGGAQYHTLFMAGYPYVTSIDVLVTGIPSVKKLTQTFVGTQLNLTWPAPSTGFNLQESDQLDPSANWTNSALTSVVTNTQNLVTVPPTNTTKFFRLRLN